MLQTQILTLYPEIFPGLLGQGLYGKAMSQKLWSLNVVNIRDAAEDKHKTVDDTPYGGGTGMLLKADVLAKSLDQNIKKDEKGILSLMYHRFEENIKDWRLSQSEAITRVRRPDLWQKYKKN